MKLGVIVGRFQTSILTEAHKSLIERVFIECDDILICIGNSQVRNTRKEPLPYEFRKTMVDEFCNELFGNVIVVPKINHTIKPIPDIGNLNLWCERLDEIIETHINETNNEYDDIMVYGGRDSVSTYYNGKFKLIVVEIIPNISATQVRNKIYEGPVQNNSDFRSGMIYASQWRFPCGFPTADAACIKYNDNGETEILLCRKPNRTQYQLPGGFFDPILDTSLENTALRELYEETNISGEIWNYVGSYVVNDYRYSKEIDKIITTVYRVIWIEGEPIPHDDIEEVKWFPVKHVLENFDELIFPAHVRIVLDVLSDH